MTSAPFCSRKNHHYLLKLARPCSPPSTCLLCCQAALTEDYFSFLMRYFLWWAKWEGICHKEKDTWSQVQKGKWALGCGRPHWWWIKGSIKVTSCCKISPFPLQLCLWSCPAPARTEICLRGRARDMRELGMDHYCLSKHKISVYFPTVVLWENKNRLFPPVTAVGSW